LITPEMLEKIPCELRIARKYPGRADLAQDEMDQWVIDAALSGKQVVRLKCGDPFVFGRGGEEVTIFESRGLEVVVLPGISSALAGPLSAGIPATMRGLADRVLFITGQGAGNSAPHLPEFDPQMTIVLLMGVGGIKRIAQEMLDKDYPEDLPVTCIERAYHPDERTTPAQLSTLCRQMKLAQVRAPAILVFGKVASFPRRKPHAKNLRPAEENRPPDVIQGVGIS